MSKIMNGSLSGKDGKLLLGWERVGGGGGGGEMTLHVLAYHPRGSKNKKKKWWFFLQHLWQNWPSCL